MKNRMMFVIAAGLLAINVIQTADAQQNRGENTQLMTPEQFQAWEANLIKALKLTNEQNKTFMTLQQELRTNFGLLQQMGAEERKVKGGSLQQGTSGQAAKALCQRADEDFQRAFDQTGRRKLQRQEGCAAQGTRN